MILTVTANPAVDKVYFVNEFVMGNVYRPKDMKVSAGGKGLNVSRVATIIGQPVTAMGFLGGGTGEFIKKETEALGIIASFTPIAGETRTCINISNDSGISGEILEPGPTITPSEKEEFFTLFHKKIDLCDVVCVSGSLPKGLDNTFYIELVNICKQKKKPVIVDTSGQTMLDIIEESPFMVKPNSDEIAQFFGKSPESVGDIKNALRLLKDKGVALPLITLGKNGAVALIEKEFYHFKTPDIAVKNSVGSGDSVVAGIATGICKGLPITDAIRLGMACGVSNTQFEQTGMVTCEMVDKYYKDVTVEKLYI